MQRQCGRGLASPLTAELELATAKIMTSVSACKHTETDTAVPFGFWSQVGEQYSCMTCASVDMRSKFAEGAKQSTVVVLAGVRDAQR